MKILVVLSILLSVGFAMNASANDAGCGLGSLVIQKNTKLSQSLAATTNGTFLSQFFGITSGTSNCTANGFAFREKEATVYAEANMQNLKVDMARGQGENLSAFAQLLGCKADGISAFGNMTRAKYERIFPRSDIKPSELLHSVEWEIINDSKLNSNCTAAS